MEKNKGNFHFWLTTSIRILLFLTAFILLSVFIKNSFTRLPDTKMKQKKLATSILNNLEKGMHDRSIIDFNQRIFPEGACFSLLLYSISWSNIAVLNLDDTELVEKAISEASWAIDEFQKEYVTSIFTDTEVENGVLWMGQLNLMLGKFSALVKDNQDYSKHVDMYHYYSKTLNNAYENNSICLLNTYPFGCWTADNATAILSLALHDQLYETNYNKTCSRWTKWFIENPDTTCGLPPAKVNNANGFAHEPSRGSSNSWIVTILSHFDESTASLLYERHRKHFTNKLIGFNTFREYMKGSRYKPDVDSGPVVLGSGVTVSASSIITAVLRKDYETANDINIILNMFCYPHTFSENGKSYRSYLFKKFPIADLFIVWQYSMLPVDEIAEEQDSGKSNAWIFRTILFIFMIVILLYLRQIIKSILQHHGYR